jgi:hypothetical protein
MKIEKVCGTCGSQAVQIDALRNGTLIHSHGNYSQTTILSGLAGAATATPKPTSSIGNTKRRTHDTRTKNRCANIRAARFLVLLRGQAQGQGHITDRSGRAAGPQGARI